MSSLFYLYKLLYPRLSKGVCPSKIKRDLLKLFESNQTIRGSDLTIDHKNQATLHILYLFQESNKDKHWSSHEAMIDNFIDQMKYLYCSVYAYHERKFERLWYVPDKNQKYWSWKCLRTLINISDYDRLSIFHLR